MKKIICKVEYDTENAEIVLKHTEGQLGDPAGYEETLYVTADGKYFLYVNGGIESIHPEETSRECPQRRLRNGRPLTRSDAFSAIKSRALRQKKTDGVGFLCFYEVILPLKRDFSTKKPRLLLQYSEFYGKIIL